MKHTFIFTCTDNGGGYQSFEVRATDKQEAIRKGMKTAKKFACGDICGDWECKLKKEGSVSLAGTTLWSGACMCRTRTGQADTTRPSASRSGW